MQPTPYIAPPQPRPAGHWLQRALVALFVERRLPYQIRLRLDRVCKRIGLRTKTVEAEGFKLRVRRLTCDELFVQNIIINHEYTPPGFDIHESDTVIDIGGNIGTFAFLASRQAPKGRVYTFEPNSENYDLLLQNISLNQGTNICATKAAVSDSRGSLKLFCAGEGGYHSVVKGILRGVEKYELVNSISLKDIFDEHEIKRCDFLKLDCEGAEYKILYSLPREYYSRIEKIALEYHGGEDAAERRKEADALVSHLEDMGFRIEAYTEFVGFRSGHIRARKTGAAAPG